MDNLKNLKSSQSDKNSKEKARKLLGDQGSVSEMKTKIRLFKEGGTVKKTCNKMKGGR